MAKPRMDLSAFGKLLEEHDGDVLREEIRVLSHARMETEVAGLMGAERHQRTAYRNGNRTRNWDTQMRTIELAKEVRPGTYFPPLLQPRRAEHALLAVVRRPMTTASRRGRSMTW